MRRRLTKHTVSAIAIIIIATLLVTLLLDWLGFFSRIDSITFDHRVSLYRTDEVIHEDVVVVLIDEKSLQQMDGEFGRWPWPRSAYSDLLEFFAIAKAQAFAFDILFVEQENAGDLSQSDLQLVVSTGKAGNAVHAMQLLKSSTSRDLPKDFARIHAVEAVEFKGEDYNDFLIPFDALYKATRDVGIIEIDPDRDGVYRKVRLFNRFNGGDVFPALSSALTLPLVAGDAAISYDENFAKMGHLQIPLDGKGRFLINPYGSVESFSAAQVFAAMKQIKAGEKENLILDPERFAGKIVLLGASAIGLLDVKSTALSSRQAGVFLHAYTVSNILLQDFLVLVSQSMTVILILLLSCVCVIPVVLLQKQMFATMIPLSASILYVVFAYSEFSKNLVYPVFPVLFAAAFSLLLAHSYRTYKEKFSEQKIRKMLSQYVSPTVLSEVIDSKDDLHAEVGTTETLTILFSDIRSFTNLSETIEADKVVDLLNIYFTEMTEIIFEHNGTLDKFIGDAIMAFWGAPIKSSDHAIEALRSAIKMRENLHLVNQKLVERNYPEIDIGIGIHTGKVVLGNIGSERKLDYTVIGDSVNLTSRLEGLTKIYGCSIIISEATYLAVQPEIICVLVDKVRVKGKQLPINLYTPEESFRLENGLPSASNHLKDQFDEAFSAYLRRDWQIAIEKYELIGSCALTKMFVERCIRFIDEKPAEDWDGVYTFTIK